MSADLSGVDLSGAFPVQVRDQIARLTSAFARVIERLESEVARLERELRVERAITRVAICAGCGGAFSPSRQPTAGRKSWCAACKSEGRDAVDRKRRQRERWVTLARNGDGDRAGDPTPEHQSDWADWAKR